MGRARVSGEALPDGSIRKSKGGGQHLGATPSEPVASFLIGAQSKQMHSSRGEWASAAREWMTAMRELRRTFRG